MKNQKIEVVFTSKQVLDQLEDLSRTDPHFADLRDNFFRRIELDAMFKSRNNPEYKQIIRAEIAKRRAEKRAKQ